MKGTNRGAPLDGKGDSLAAKKVSKRTGRHATADLKSFRRHGAGVSPRRASSWPTRAWTSSRSHTVELTSAFSIGEFVVCAAQIVRPSGARVTIQCSPSYGPRRACFSISRKQADPLGNALSQAAQCARRQRCHLQGLVPAGHVRPGHLRRLGPRQVSRYQG